MGQHLRGEARTSPEALAAVESARSMLFVPGDSERRIGKALASGADAVIVDLEDAVAPSAKQEARDTVRSALAGYEGPATVTVRVNAEPHLAELDLECLADLPLAAVVVPKAEVGSLDSVAAEGFAAVALVETALGLRDSAEVAAHPACRRIMLGSIDLSAELGIDPFVPGSLAYARSKLAVDSAAASIAAPIDGVHTDIADARGLTDEAEAARSHGMSGKACIHPAQVEAVHRAFSPSPEEVAEARELIEAFERAEDRGAGAIEHRGRMVDVAVVKRARRLVEAARP